MIKGGTKVEFNSDFCYARVMADDAKQWAIAEASRVSVDAWFINRVLVRQPEARGKGLGGRALDAMLNHLRDEGIKAVIVTPGGYDEDFGRQVKFYVTHGFAEIRSGMFKGAYCRQLTGKAEDVDEDFSQHGVYIMVPAYISKDDFVCHGKDRWRWTAETLTMPTIVEIKGDRLCTEAGSVAELELDSVGDAIRAAKPDTSAVVPETDED